MKSYTCFFQRNILHASQFEGKDGEQCFFCLNKSQPLKYKVFFDQGKFRGFDSLFACEIHAKRLILCKNPALAPYFVDACSCGFSCKGYMAEEVPQSPSSSDQGSFPPDPNFPPNYPCPKFKHLMFEPWTIGMRGPEGRHYCRVCGQFATYKAKNSEIYTCEEHRKWSYACVHHELPFFPAPCLASPEIVKMSCYHYRVSMNLKERKNPKLYWDIAIRSAEQGRFVESLNYFEKAPGYRSLIAQIAFPTRVTKKNSGFIHRYFYRYEPEDYLRAARAIRPNVTDPLHALPELKRFERALFDIAEKVGVFANVDKERYARLLIGDATQVSDDAALDLANQLNLADSPRYLSFYIFISERRILNMALRNAHPVIGTLNPSN